MIFTVSLSITVALSACQDRIAPGKAEVKRPHVTGVVVLKIEPVQVDAYYETSGTVRAKATAAVSSRVIGVVATINVKEGDGVRAGQVLITLDNRDAVQRVKAAEFGLAAAKDNSRMAELTYQRYKKLYDEKALSGQEIDQIETQKKVAESEYARLKTSLEEANIYREYARIKAPASGRVTEKKIEVGSMAMPGVPLLILESDSGFLIEAYADESLSGKLKKGMPAEAVIDAIGSTLKGTITEIVPAIDSRSRTYLIKIAVSSSKLKSGLYSKVMIRIGKRDTLVVPAKAVIEKGQLTGVYNVDEEGIITYRLVKTGKFQGGNIEILSGLVAGNRIITEGAEKAVDGGIVDEGKSR